MSSVLYMQLSIQVSALQRQIAHYLHHLHSNGPPSLNLKATIKIKIKIKTRTQTEPTAAQWALEFCVAGSQKYFTGGRTKVDRRVHLNKHLGLKDSTGKNQTPLIPKTDS